MRETPPDRPLDAEALHDLVDRWRGGDRAAADDLLRRAGRRLERIARALCQGFPTVTGRADPGDVLNAGLVRLLQTLRTVRPADPRAFYNLAAVHLRRELIDLARYHRLRRRAVPLDPGPGAADGPAEPAAPPPADDLDFWARFHEAVDRLPVAEREVVGLAFYHGWTHARIAELFGVDERTVRRRWAAATARLRELVGSEAPGE